MVRPDRVRWSKVALLTGLVLASLHCSDASPIGPGKVREVRMVPDSLTLDVGQSLPLRAFPVDADSAFIASKHLDWTSDQPGIATVDDTGAVHGEGLGSAVISADAGGITGTATVRVSAPEFAFPGVDTARLATYPLNPDSVALNVQVRTKRFVELEGLQLGAITYGAGGNGWLHTALSTATTPAVLTLSTSGAGLAVGTYNASIPLTSTTSGVAAATLEVVLTVQQGPVISPSPSTVNFFAAPGGADPAPVPVQISNNGNGALTGLSIGTIVYGAGASGWISSAALNQNTAPATLTVAAQVGALAGGVYTATIPISSAAAVNSPQNVSVTFTVTNQATIVLSSGSANVIAAHRDFSPAASTVNVTNGSGGSLGSLSTSVAYDTATPGWLTASLNTTTAPAVLTLTPASINLRVGTFVATVTVSSPLALNSPRTFTYTLVVQASFKNDIQQILHTNCTTCHSPNPFPLPDPWPYNQLVNAGACNNGTNPDSVWVRPGDLNNSYLWNLTNGVTTCGFTTFMPPSGLSTAFSDLIRQWILSGAPDN